MARAAGLVLLLGAVALPAEPPVVVFAVSERFHPVALNWLIFFAASGTPATPLPLCFDAPTAALFETIGLPCHAVRDGLPKGAGLYREMTASRLAVASSLLARGRVGRGVGRGARAARPRGCAPRRG